MRPALAGVCRELFGSRRVLLAGNGEWFDLGDGKALGPVSEPQVQGQATPRVWRFRPGPSAVGAVRAARHPSAARGAEGVPVRSRSRRAYRVCASQAFGRHSPQQPLEYVGRWGKAHSEETLTPFHHRLILGALRLAQAGCQTHQGVACSINTLLLAAEGKGTASCRPRGTRSSPRSPGYFTPTPRTRRTTSPSTRASLTSPSSAGSSGRSSKTCSSGPRRIRSGSCRCRKSWSAATTAG